MVASLKSWTTRFHESAPFRWCRAHHMLAPCCQRRLKDNIKSFDQKTLSGTRLGSGVLIFSSRQKLQFIHGTSGTTTTTTKNTDEGRGYPGLKSGTLGCRAPCSAQGWQHRAGLCEERLGLPQAGQSRSQTTAPQQPHRQAQLSRQ